MEERERERAIGTHLREMVESSPRLSLSYNQLDQLVVIKITKEKGNKSDGWLVV